MTVLKNDETFTQKSNGIVSYSLIYCKLSLNDSIKIL